VFSCNHEAHSCCAGGAFCGWDPGAVVPLPRRSLSRSLIFPLTLPFNSSQILGIFEPFSPCLVGSRDMWRAYRDMKEANWKNSDKYFHARGNYDAAHRGPGGRWAAKIIRHV